MIAARSGVYIWTSWLAKLMAGEVSCCWAPWFRSHYRGYARTAGDFQRAQWLTDHTRAVTALAQEQQALGNRVWKETQNSFTLRVGTGVVLGGKPDLICESPGEPPVIFDLKTGHPKGSDILQVMLYQLCVPCACARYRGLQMAGCVVYSTGERQSIPPEAIDDGFKRRVRYFVDLLAAPRPPPRVPSAGECRWCDITAADCEERVEWSLGAETEEPPALDWGLPLP